MRREHRSISPGVVAAFAVVFRADNGLEAHPIYDERVRLHLGRLPTAADVAVARRVLAAHKARAS